MASAQYGVIVTGLKGNIGGSTFQNGNVSKILRNKGYRKGTTSQNRQTQLSRLIGATSSWRTLGIVNTKLWGGSAGNWPFKDKFGNTYYGSGYQKYVAQSIALTVLGFPLITTPDLPLSADNPGPFSLDFSTGGGLIVNWVTAPTHDQFIQVFASTQLSAGRNGRNVKKILITQANMIGNTSQNITGDWTGVYGTLSAGSIISVDIVVRTQQFPIVQFPSSLVAQVS